MSVQKLTKRGYVSTILWTFGISGAIVFSAAALGRAAININGALIDKPDIAVYLLLPEEEIRSVSLLRESETERHYLAETKDGPKLIILKFGEQEWFVSKVEPLRE